MLVALGLNQSAVVDRIEGTDEVAGCCPFLDLEQSRVKTSSKCFLQTFNEGFSGSEGVLGFTTGSQEGKAGFTGVMIPEGIIDQAPGKKIFIKR